MKILEIVAEPDGGIRVYHGTLAGEIDNAFAPETHFGTSNAANERIATLTKMRPTHRPPQHRAKTRRNDRPAIYPVKIYPKKVLRLPDIGMWDEGWELADELKWKGVITREQFDWIRSQDPYGSAVTDVLRQLGYDAVVYQNHTEDAGQDSYIVLDPSIIHSY